MGDFGVWGAGKSWFRGGVGGLWYGSPKQGMEAVSRLQGSLVGAIFVLDELAGARVGAANEWGVSKAGAGYMRH